MKINKKIKEILNLIVENTKIKSRISELLKDRLKTKVIIGLFSISILIPVMGIIFLFNISYVTYTSENLEHLLKEKEIIKNRVNFFQNKIPKIYKMINDFEIDKNVLIKYPDNGDYKTQFKYDEHYKTINSLENEQYQDIKEVINYLDEFNTESAKEAVKNKLEYNLDEYKQVTTEHLAAFEKDIVKDKKTIKIFKHVLIFLVIALTIISIGISLTIVILVLRDIKQQKESNRLKNEFISTVSHELRTPLTSIRGALGLVLSGALGTMSDNIKDLLEIANNNSIRLISLINDILDIEKIESGKMAFNPEKLEIVPIIEQVIEENKTYAQQFNVNITLTNLLSNEKIFADKNRLVQVLTNLLSNAVKFSSSGESVNILVYKNNGKINISIKDKGIGIPKDFRNQIFQKFAQADSSDSRKKGGTGLGLSISKAIIEKMGGTIGFESKSGEGTRFYIDLIEVNESQDLYFE